MNLRDGFVLETRVEYASWKNGFICHFHYQIVHVVLTYALHVGSPAIDKWLPSYL